MVWNTWHEQCGNLARRQGLGDGRPHQTTRRRCERDSGGMRDRHTSPTSREKRIIGSLPIQIAGDNHLRTQSLAPDQKSFEPTRSIPHRAIGGDIGGGGNLDNNRAVQNLARPNHRDLSQGSLPKYSCASLSGGTARLQTRWIRAGNSPAMLRRKSNQSARLRCIHADLLPAHDSRLLCNVGPEDLERPRARQRCDINCRNSDSFGGACGFQPNRDRRIGWFADIPASIERVLCPTGIAGLGQRCEIR